MKYIDAEKLIAEIERHRQAIRVLNEHTAPEQTSKTCAIFQYPDTILSELLSFIDSLQQEQPEVDLEVKKQIEELANDWHHKGFASDEDCPLCMQDLIDILWHFYELGQRRAAEMYDEIEYNRQRAEEENK